MRSRGDPAPVAFIGGSLGTPTDGESLCPKARYARDHPQETAGVAAAISAAVGAIGAILVARR